MSKEPFIGFKQGEKVYRRSNTFPDDFCYKATVIRPIRGKDGSANYEVNTATFAGIQVVHQSALFTGAIPEGMECLD